jgi:UDP-N-acetylmuramoylalanine--D-glutamate ligase
MNLKKFVLEILENKKVKKILFLGKIASNIDLENDKIFKYEKYDWENVLNVFFSENKTNTKNKVLLFSPGMPSFDNFKNFEERGDFFKRIIRNIYEKQG